MTRAITSDLSDRDLIEVVGQLLFGGRWKNDLWQPLGISRPLLYMIAAGRRTMTAATRAKLLALVEDQPRVLGLELADRLARLGEVAAVLRSRE